MKKYIRICPRCGNTYESDQSFTPICKACMDEISEMRETLENICKKC